MIWLTNEFCRAQVHSHAGESRLIGSSGAGLQKAEAPPPEPQASNLISDGSELLLLVPALAGVVGSVVLPVLGYVVPGRLAMTGGAKGLLAGGRQGCAGWRHRALQVQYWQQADGSLYPAGAEDFASLTQPHSGMGPDAQEQLSVGVSADGGYGHR
jgi:hypothetical protein